jgi:predicted RNase H-like nuclease (RuvC/YqgF family)
VPTPTFALSAEDVSAAAGVLAGAAGAVVAAAVAVWALRERVGGWLLKHRGEAQALSQGEREQLQREEEAGRESARKEASQAEKECWAAYRRQQAIHEAERKYLESSCREAYQRRDEAAAAERETALRAARLEEQVRHLTESVESLRREVAELRRSLGPGTDEHKPPGGP